MKRQWEILWYSGYREVVEAKDYTEAHRKAHNRANWTQLGPVYHIGILIKNPWHDGTILINPYAAGK